MKKVTFFALFLTFILYSCSKQIEDLELKSELELSSVAENAEILRFENLEEFFETYEEISNFNKYEDFSTWFAKKGFSNSFLQSNYNRQIDTVNFDLASDKRELYSEALKGILNKDMEFIIGGSTIKLKDGQLIRNSAEFNENDIFSKKLILGSVNNKLLDEQAIDIKEDNSLSERSFNNNSSYTISYGFNSGAGRSTCNGGSIGSSRQRRFLNDIFSETISINGVSTNRLYFRSRLESRFCSVWRCKWENTPGEFRRITFTNFVVSGDNVNIFRPTSSGVLANINALNPISFSVCTSGTYTVNIGTGTGPWSGSAYYNIVLPANVYFLGTIKSEHLPASGSVIPTWNQNANQFN